MRRIALSKLPLVWLSLAIGATAVAVFVACGGSSESSDVSGGPAAGDAGTSTISAAPGSCANSTVDITFSPMYSAFIPNSQHTFQIPAVVTDGSPATWSLADPTQAQLAVQTFDGISGVMITVQGTGAGGKITVIATKSDGTCGTAPLTITSATDDDWEIGNARYNDGVALHLPSFDGGRPEGGPGFGDGGFEGGGPRTRDGGSFFETDGGTACTNCHGVTATTGPYADVSHTPEQTGGFSDSELLDIILRATVPDGGYFDPTVLNSNCDGGADCTARAYERWQSFHLWTDITPDQYQGIVIYLRSLQPASQTGKANFGGRGPRRPRDGG
jgi:hypothetical protein